MEVLPYKGTKAGKKEQVAAMFDNISNRYDFLNHFLSLGIDIIWRRRAIKNLKRHNPGLILDVATGTGDFAIESLKLSPQKVTGIDISNGMLDVGRKKILEMGHKDQIELIEGDSENIPFEDNIFDAVIVAFGVRNFENLDTGLSEMYRVLRKGGMVVILEFSKPHTFPFKQLYNFYFRAILPLIGKFVSKDNTAYTYLPESVKAFPDGDTFTEILKNIGFNDTKCDALTFGISSIYTGQK